MPRRKRWGLLSKQVKPTEVKTGQMTNPEHSTYLAVDLVLQALIGPPKSPVESCIERAEAGETAPVITDVALYCAACSVRPGDAVDFPRFARLLRCAVIQATRVVNDRGQAPPTEKEISNWRQAALRAQGELGTIEFPSVDVKPLTKERPN